jgi:hypothetical protein
MTDSESTKGWTDGKYRAAAGSQSAAVKTKRLIHLTTAVTTLRDYPR